MIDRELLEAAAKAAGLRVGFEPDGKERGRYDLYWSHVHHQLCWHGKSRGSEYPVPIFWNPLTDDGDAFRLAVKLKMEIVIGQMTVCALVRGQGFAREAIGQLDPLAATRRAIVRVAAILGGE